MPVNAYIHAVRQELSSGIAREHAFRPALKALLEALDPSIVAVNDPAQVACGAPDFRVTRSGVPQQSGVETKDMDANLGEVARGEQLRRYLAAIPNLILTNYLEFRWYVDGQLRETARLGERTDDRTLHTTHEGAEALEGLLRAFLAHQAPATGTAQELAARMAHLAQMVRDATVGVLRTEGEAGQLHGQLEAFRQVLLPDLSEDDFADMYAQTLAYGLFAARCHQPAGQGFTRWDAARDLPPTNPFLQRLFHELAGPALDARIAWVVDDLADFLARANMGNVLEDFAHQTGREDPVVHFYETFLREYNPRMRELRGVYYTPEPVVSYIVRSVDHILKTDFGRPLGLADPEVFILDPACGTGTFLYFVIRHIHQTVVKQMGAGAWPSYVREHLLRRVFGFELLMAPYTIAHMKLAMLLRDLGYDFPDNQRLGIYLTNTLEEAARRSDLLLGGWISDEANAAAAIKSDKPIMVVLGNPPYAKCSANRGAYAHGLVQPYMVGLESERNVQPVHDDYIKFLAFAQQRIARTGHGIVGFITNHTYLSAVIHRGVRNSLMGSFDDIRVLDLHGNSQVRETPPDGLTDENVFDIQQGVAISVLVRRAETPEPRRAGVRHSELWGSRAAKHAELDAMSVEASPGQELAPFAPYFFFVPKHFVNGGIYDALPRVCDIFPEASSGIKTHRDHFVLDLDRQALEGRLEAFVAPECSAVEARQRFSLRETDAWRVQEAQAALRADGAWQRRIVRCLYRPFDARWLIHHPAVLDRPRESLMRHMVAGPNLGLVVNRTTGQELPFTHALCTRLPIDVRTLPDFRGAPYLLPLYLYPSDDALGVDDGRRPNLAPGFVRDVSDRLGLTFAQDGEGDLEATFGPEDVFHYVYAILHSPTYRERYSEFLRIDFPRIPLSSDLELFRRLCALGKELVGLHVMESPALDDSPARFEGAGDNEVERVRYDASARSVHINRTQVFSGVAPEVYEFEVGGYQVLDKWLKDRKGRKLSFDDITHYRRVVKALQETMRLMEEVDEAVPDWPIS